MKGQILKKINKLFLALLIIVITCAFSLNTTIASSDYNITTNASNAVEYLDSEVDTDTLIRQLIQYYANYQETAQTDIERILDSLREIDEELYEEWSQIMDYWDYVNTDMTVYTGCAPDGLPEDDSLCIVVLGYALNADGSMQDELIGRLTVALASAEKYPNAYVAVTGGGTAANNPDATEADQMAEWLIQNGLDESRIIIENNSQSTVQNAQFTYAILRANYPQISSLCMITSDYHVPRGCLLYYAQCLISAYEAGDKQLEIVSNAGYVTGRNGYESISLQASGLASVAGISVNTSEVPDLSKLTGLTITGDTEYQLGSELNIKITANYDTGYSRDVTSLCSINGFDSLTEGEQTIVVSYTENGITKETSLTILVNNIIDDTDDSTSPEDTSSSTPEDTSSSTPEDTSTTTDDSGDSQTDNSTSDNNLSSENITSTVPNTGDDQSIFMWVISSIVGCFGVINILKNKFLIK